MAKQTNNKAKSWEVGTIRRNEESGEVRLVLNKGVKIMVDDREMDAGDFNTVFLKNVDELSKDMDYYIEQGWSTEDDKAETLAKYAEKGVRYSLRMKFKE